MADAVDDTMMNDYLAESREHLADIESDLLTMEGAGANIDEALVNKVFRAAHSIKGGAGFFALHKIQELAHKMENVLQMVRAREMTPTPEVINILLLAFDKLREMINDAKASNQADVTEFVVALTGLASAHLAPEKKGSLTANADVTPRGVTTALKASEFDLARARREGQYVYLVEYDLIHDLQRQCKSPLEVVRSIAQCGTIFDCGLALEAGGTLDDEPDKTLPMQMLVGTVLEPHLAADLFEVGAEHVHLVLDITAPEKAASSVPASSAPPSPPPSPAPGPQAAAVTATPAVPEPAPTRAVAAVAAAPHGENGPTSVAANPGKTLRARVASTTAVSSSGPVDASLRVSVGLLESLMNLAGELVLSRNQLVEAVAREDMRAVAATGQRINLVTSELQETIMLTRMQPIGNIFSKFPRLVRDLAKELGKEIELQVDGKEVEMDKTIIEGLSDPLTHMVRNAVDHGVEATAARVKAGKAPIGRVHLKAYHAAGQVVIEIADDGKGIDGERVAAAALSKGLITESQLADLNEKERINLIFLPGLSTAEKVTDVSGRGVGMDVVKTNLDKLGGKVEIDSERGKGSTFRIKLPLTLAIIPSLLVSVAKERFAIPQVSVAELIRLRPEQIKERIEVIGNAEVLRLRGKLIPIVHLSKVLGLELERAAEDGAQPNRRIEVADRRSPRYAVDETTRVAAAAPPADAGDRRVLEERRISAPSDMSIVVVTAGSLQYGLIVEDLHDTVEIVVKPLGRYFKTLREYAGATILGDGQVALILDVTGVANKVELSIVASSARAQELAAQAQREQGQDVQSLLLFRNGAEEACAVPLSLVARVEQVQASQISRIGGRRTMQYRGGCLPLVTLADAAQVEAVAQDQGQVVIVFEMGGREIGLLAAMPVDVMETGAEVDHTTLQQKGVMGSLIIKDRTTLLVDIFELVESTLPDLVAQRKADRALPSKGGLSGPSTILLAEDSDFFRNQVKRFLESDGHVVLDAPDGQAAWELLQENADRVQLIVTDVEMPRMTGLELAKRIRQDEQVKHLAIIALTSLASEDDIAKGKASGVTEYQVKLDKETLLETVHKLLPKLPGKAAA